MKTNVVKTRVLSNLLVQFNEVINSSLVRKLAGNKIQDFTRIRKMSYANLLYYLIFRDNKNTNTELTSFFMKLGVPKNRISKQALHKAVKKLNSNVFMYLINRFAELFYQSSLNKTYKGYNILAEDGTYIDIPYNVVNLYNFQFMINQHVTSMFDIKKIQSKSAGLYDVLNGLFIDFTMDKATRSETPLAFSHLYRTRDMLKDKKVIYLADRYYGSAEVISHLESLGYKYCIRGKSYFYKKQVESMTTDDEWIEVLVDEKWVKRFRFSLDAIKQREVNPVLKIRVVKYKYQYKDKKGNHVETELIYFTNLNEEEFSKEEIIQLYTMRWDCEVSYKTLKTDQELERYFCQKGEVAKCCVYAKIVFHNIAGILRKELNRELKVTNDINNKYEYTINITQLHTCLKSFNIMKPMTKGIKSAIKNVLENIRVMKNKIKVPIRPDRHNQRWGRFIKTPPSYRFRLDGRNNPKVKRYKGGLLTVSP